MQFQAASRLHRRTLTKRKQRASEYFCHWPAMKTAPVGGGDNVIGLGSFWPSYLARIKVNNPFWIYQLLELAREDGCWTIAERKSTIEDRSERPRSSTDRTRVS